MGRLRVFQGFVIALTLIFLSMGGTLVREYFLHSEQPWALLGGALLCSLALFFVYFLLRQRASGKHP
jgi:hypothetical protein